MRNFFEIKEVTYNKMYTFNTEKVKNASKEGL